jgi:hypothetical protein
MSLLPSYRLVAVSTSLLSGWRDCCAAYGRRIRTAVDRLVSQVDKKSGVLLSWLYVSLLRCFV